VSSADDPKLNADEFRKLHAFLEQRFPLVHARLKREFVGDLSLLFTWQGSDPTAKPIALMAHHDVAPIAPGTEARWQVPPFDGVVKDGYVWGRGAWDDKGNLVAQLEAVEMLLAAGFQPRQTVYIVSGADEEVSGQRGAAAIVKLLQERKVRLDFVIDEGLVLTEGVIPGLTGELKGVARELFDTLAPEMRGLQRVALSNLWLFGPIVEKQLAKAPSTNAMLRTTTALTIVNAGNKHNVIPGVAEAVLDFRILPGDTRQTVLQHVRDKVGPEVEVSIIGRSTDPTPITSTDTASYRAMERTLRSLFPDTLVAPALYVAASDSQHFVPIADSIYRFSPVRAKPEDLPRLHGTNERISVANLGELVRFYHQLLRNLNAPAP
jgi:carboxypeptidase PM20D1